MSDESKPAEQKPAEVPVPAPEQTKPAKAVEDPHAKPMRLPDGTEEMHRRAVEEIQREQKANRAAREKASQAGQK